MQTPVSAHGVSCGIFKVKFVLVSLRTHSYGYERAD